MPLASRHRHFEVVFTDDPSIFPAVGFIHLDTDQNPGTGVPPDALGGLPTQDIGVDFFLDLFNVPDVGLVVVVACLDVDCTAIDTVPGGYVGNTLLVSVPLAMLDGDDGMMDVTGFAGDFFGPTDWVPDAGHGTVGGVEEPAPWICTDPDTGMLDPSTSLDVDVLLNCERALPAGLHMGEVVIEHDDPNQGPVFVPVSLTVNPGVPAEIDVDPASFDEILGTDEMRTVQLSIINPDPLGGVLTFNISVENFVPAVAPWASVSPVAGFVDPDTTTVVDLMLDASGLPDGVYLADLVIGNNDPDENPTVVPVQISVSAPDIDVEPDAVSSTQDRDQIRTADLTVINSGAGTLAFDIEIMDTTAIVSLGGGGELTAQALGGSSDGSVGASNSGGSAASPSAYRWESAEPSDMHILIYADDAYHTAPNTFLDQALQALGLGYTAYYDSDFGGFEAALAGGTYDLVLFGNDNWAPPASTIDALNAYVMGGGKLIYQSWQVSSQLGHPLLDALGVMWVSDDFDPPDPVYWWDPGHPFFTNPEMVPELTQLEGGRYGVYGQYVEPMDGYEALAGYTTPGPDANQAALILGNEGRTVFKGFMDGQNDADLAEVLVGDGLLDGVELWINMIVGVGEGVGVGWLRVEPAAGTVGPGGEMALDVIFDATDLASGLYTAEIVINNNSVDDQVVVPVTLAVDITGVRGVVLLEAQNFHGGTAVYFEGPESLTVFTDDEGNFVAALAPGNYMVMAWHPYHLAAMAVIDVTPDGTSELMAVLLAGDLNNDGVIDVRDLMLVGKNQGRDESPWMMP